MPRKTAAFASAGSIAIVMVALLIVAPAAP
jgi:hypothetical protein